MSITFPQGFTFGAATASYQIEGAAHEGGRGPSIWDTFSHTPGKVINGDTGDVACDHYHRWESDLDILQEMGVDSYRLSIAWPRIQPTGKGTPNQAGIEFYSRLIDGLLARGIQPLVTLYHWDLPQALEDQGGWLNRDTAYRFGEYAEIVGQALGDRVVAWATLNEPWCAAVLGYGNGEHAPGIKSRVGALVASHHLNLAHGIGVQALRSIGAQRVGTVLNPQTMYPASDKEKDQEAWARADAMANRLYADPVLLGGYNDLTVEATKDITNWDFVRDGDLDLMHQPIDYVGLNYYSAHVVKAGTIDPSASHDDGSAWVGAEDVQFVEQNRPVTDMGWAIIPSGLTDVLKMYHERYPDVDLVVAENGAAMPDRVSEDGHVHDNGRIDYIESHIRAVHQAIAEGVPVTGYYAWSLMDNFEWAFGYTKRFGLIRVDYQTQERTWKDSARWYQRFLATRTLDD